MNEGKYYHSRLLDLSKVFDHVIKVMKSSMLN
jgi:hypothetical protein